MSSTDTKPYIVLSPKDVTGPVEAWSIRPLPFEHKKGGWTKPLRSEIKDAIEQMENNSTNILHAVYKHKSPPSTRTPDVENILFYNVGSKCFAHLVRTGFRFERCLSDPPEPPSSMGLTDLHYSCYSLGTGQESFAYWKPTRVLARWDGVKMGTIKQDIKPAWLWYRMKESNIEISAEAKREPRLFGLNVTIRTPRQLNLASLVKPVFDGIISSFHQHDGTDEAAILERLSQQLEQSEDRLGHYLKSKREAVLGKTRFLFTRGNGLQWSPRDDLCVAGAFFQQYDHSSSEIELSGELFEVEVL